MGDALLQKTYTADFLNKRQVRNNGEIAQVYVKDSHKAVSYTHLYGSHVCNQ